VGSDSKNGVRHQRALSPRLSMMMMMMLLVDRTNLHAYGMMLCLSVVCNIHIVAKLDSLANRVVYDTNSDLATTLHFLNGGTNCTQILALLFAYYYILGHAGSLQLHIVICK